MCAHVMSLCVCTCDEWEEQLHKTLHHILFRVHFLFSCSDDVEATPTSSTNGAGNVSLMAQKWVPPDDDIPLESDALDVDEYINTEDEVTHKCMCVCVHVCVVCMCVHVCVYV